jgi:hypothetical protein
MANPFDQFDAPAKKDANPFDQFDGADQVPPPQSSGSLTDLALAPGVSALQLAGGAPGLPMDVFGLLGQGLNWLTGREWRPGMDPAQSGMTQADWLRAAQKPVAAPQFAPIGISQPLEIAGRFLAGQGGLGLPPIVGQEPATEGERIGRKAGQLVFGGGPAGAGAGLTATATSEIGRALDKAGVTGGYGEVGGLLVGPLVHEGVKAVGRAALPRVREDIAQSARFLADRGVPVSPVQMAESDMPGYWRSGADTASLLPSNFPQRQNREFVRLLSTTIGESEPRITQQVLDRARARIAGNLERTYAGTTVDIANQPNLVNALSTIEATARRSLGNEQFGVVERAINGTFDDLVQMGPTPGNIVWNRFKTGSIDPLNAAINSADPTVSTLGRQIKSAILDAMADNAPAQFRTELRGLNQQYSNLKTLERVATKGKRGFISPESLLAAVKSEQGHVRSDLGQIASAAKDVLTELPNSGTSQRGLAAWATSGGVAGGGFLAGGPTGLGVALTAPPAVRGLLDSQTFARAMINKALPQPNPGLLGALGGVGQAYARAAPGTVGLLGRQYVSPQYFHTGLLAP